MKKLFGVFFTGFFLFTNMSFADGGLLSMRGKDKLRPKPLEISFSDVDTILGGLDYRIQAGSPYLETFTASMLFRNAHYFVERTPEDAKQWSGVLSATFALTAIGKALDYEAIRLKIATYSAKEWIDRAAWEILSNTSQSSAFLDYWKLKHKGKKKIPRHTVLDVWNYLREAVGRGMWVTEVNVDPLLDNVKLQWYFRPDHSKPIDEQRTLPDTVAQLKESIEVQLTPLRKLVRRKTANSLLFKKYNDLLNPFHDRWAVSEMTDRYKHLNPVSEIMVMNYTELKQVYDKSIQNDRGTGGLVDDLAFRVTRDFKIGQVKVSGNQACIENHFFGNLKRLYSNLKIALYQEIQKDLEAGKITEDEASERLVQGRHTIASKAVEQSKEALPGECLDLNIESKVYNEKFDNFRMRVYRLNDDKQLRIGFLNARHQNLVIGDPTMRAIPFFETIEKDKRGNYYFLYLVEEAETKRKKIPYKRNYSDYKQSDPRYILYFRLRDRIVESRLRDKMRLTLRSMMYNRYKIFVNTDEFSFEGIDGLKLSSTLRKPMKVVDQLLSPKSAFSINHAYMMP